MSRVALRRATLADVPTLQRWDREPHVIAATTDDDSVEKAFGDHDWGAELPRQSDVDYYLIGELEGRAIGAMQVIDPREEPTHYWGEVESARQLSASAHRARRPASEQRVLTGVQGVPAWRAPAPRTR